MSSIDRPAAWEAGIFFSFWAAVIGGVCYLNHQSHVEDAIAATVKQQHVAAVAGNTQSRRLTEILNDQDDNDLGMLAARHIRAELTPDLPAGAMVQIDPQAIRVNRDLARDVQDDVLRLSSEFIKGQIGDGLPYATGKAYTLGSGRLVQISKNATGYEKILAPVPDQR